MIEKFKDEYHWMLRQSKGYFPWLNGNNGYRLGRHVFGKHHGECMRCHDDYNSRELIKEITESSLFENQLFDLFFKALLRAEIRLISRFVPQRSHEERLTGNLVSEIDNSIFIIKDDFREKSKELYATEKQIDFFYFDLSRGGKIEKKTGADLGFILVIDLPDYPFTVKSLILQAKKINGSSQIDRSQYEVISDNGGNDAAYLFYDMDLRTSCCPFVLKADTYNFKRKHKESIEKNTSSFSITLEEMFSDGHPLSLFLTSHLLTPNTGKEHSSFKSAFNFFRDLSYGDLSDKNSLNNFNGRLAIASIGKSINYGVNNNEGLEITI